MVTQGAVSARVRAASERMARSWRSFERGYLMFFLGGGGVP